MPSAFPFSQGDYVQAYLDVVLELHAGFSERWRAAGNYWFPKQTTYHGRGTVPSGITATSFTDPDANDGNGWDDTATDQNPWQKVLEDKRLDGNPGWYLVIDNCDANKVIKTRVTSWTATTINYVSIQDYLTSGYLGSLTELEGQDYYIIRADYGLTWAEQFIDIERPNDYEFGSGVVQAFHDAPAPSIVTSPTTTTFKMQDTFWTANEHAGRDFLVYVGTGTHGIGQLRRVTISSNSRDTLTFPTQSWTPAIGANWCIVASGGKAYPGKDKLYPATYWRGEMAGVFSHRPTPDTVGNYSNGSALIPKATHSHGNVDLAGGGGCYTDTTHAAFDNYYYTELNPSLDQLNCGYPADKIFARDFWKTFRALEWGCETICAEYVEAKSFDGADSIPPLVPATYFKSWGKNATTTAISAINGTTNVATVGSLSYLYYPCDAYYVLLDAKGNVTKSGSVSILSSSTLADAGWVMDDIGKTLVLSTGWDRYFDREFQRLYSQCVWQPDYKMTLGVEGAVDPPAVDDYATNGCNGLGRWEYKAPSNKYWEQGNYSPAEGDTCVTGQLARYVGVNKFFDGIENGTTTERAKYQDHRYVGKLNRLHEGQRRGQRRGVASSITPYSITDESQNWFDQKWYGGKSGFVSRVESGTFTSGNTLGGSDSSKASGEPSCAWDSSRFINMQPYQRFTVEIQYGDVWEKRLIRVGSSGGNMTWNEALPSSCSGHNWRINEPAYQLNRYRDVPVRLTGADGQQVTVTCQGNDATTLWLDTMTTTLMEPVTYEILEDEVGGVYRWDGTKHVLATGADSVRTFVPVPKNFRTSPTMNKPTVVHKYGRIRPGDDWIMAAQQLYYGIKALKKTRMDSPSWTPDPGTGTEDNKKESIIHGEEHWPYGNVPLDQGCLGDCDNTYLATYGSFPSDDDAWSQLMTSLIDGQGHPAPAPYDCTLTAESAGYAGATPYPDTPVPTCVVEGGFTTCGARASATRRYGYLQGSVLQPACPITNAVEWYAYSQIDSADHDIGGSCIINPDTGLYTDWFEYRYNAHSDPVKFRKFSLFSTTGNADGTVYSGPLSPGKLATSPNAIAAPAPGGCYVEGVGNHKSTYDGYLVTDQAAVISWDFSHCV
jgi:hypothetical protein